jgi:hypothetical protein
MMDCLSRSFVRRKNGSFSRNGGNVNSVRRIAIGSMAQAAQNTGSVWFDAHIGLVDDATQPTQLQKTRAVAAAVAAAIARTEGEGGFFCGSRRGRSPTVIGTHFNIVMFALDLA